MNRITVGTALAALTLCAAGAAVDAPIATSGAQYQACEAGVDLEPDAHTAAVGTTHMYANVATTAIGNAATNDYYQAYLKLWDEGFQHYIRIFVERTPNDGGTFRVSADASSGVGSSDYFTSAPNLELRYNSGQSPAVWEAYDGSNVLVTQTLNSGAQTRQFGTLIHITGSTCPTLTATYTNTAPLIGDTFYLDDALPYHTTRVSSSSVKFSGPS